MTALGKLQEQRKRPRDSGAYGGIVPRTNFVCEAPSLFVSLTSADPFPAWNRLLDVQSDPSCTASAGQWLRIISPAGSCLASHRAYRCISACMAL